MKLSEIKNTKEVKKPKAKATGYVIYEGKSRINGEEIIAVVTMKSNNVKTGNVPSMWIMYKNLPPTKVKQKC